MKILLEAWSYLVKIVAFFIVKGVNVAWLIGHFVAAFTLAVLAPFAHVTPHAMLIFTKLTILTMFGLVLFSWVKTWAGFMQDEDQEEEAPHVEQGSWQNGSGCA